MSPRPTPRGGAEMNLTRRSIVRAAGHAAWVTPVIVAASAAPAMAASGAPLVVTSGLTGIRGGAFDRYLTVTATFTNQGALATTGMAVQVTINDSATASAVLEDAPTDVSAGFTFVEITGTYGSRTYHFIKVDPQLSGSGSPSTAAATLSFTTRVYPLAASVVYGGTITALPVPEGPTGTTGVPLGPVPYS